MLRVNIQYPSRRSKLFPNYILVYFLVFDLFDYYKSCIFRKVMSCFWKCLSKGMQSGFKESLQWLFNLMFHGDSHLPTYCVFGESMQYPR